MSVPSIVKASYFTVAVEDVPGSGNYTLLCGLTTRSFADQVSTSETTVRDCMDPEAAPFAIRNVTSRAAEISGNGNYNRAQGALLRSIIGKSLNYRFIMGEPGLDAVDQGYYQGRFVFSNMTISGDDGAYATAQMTFQSDGPYAWTATTAPALATALNLTPLTASVNTQWTGTLTGYNSQSQLSVTAPGATGVSITGGTIKATWASSGSKTVTITETNAYATNSPQTTSKTVVVS